MDSFRDILRSLQAVHETLMDASQAMFRVGEQMVTVTELAIQACEEQEDLRATVSRLEALVMDLLREVRAANEGDTP